VRESLAEVAMAEATLSRSRSRLGRRVANWAFCAWALASFVVVASLMLSHAAEVPRPATDQPELRAAIARSRTREEHGHWLALHVVYARCRCSQGVLSQLFARGPHAAVRERIVLVGAHAEYEKAARTAGFAVEVLEPHQLKARYRLEAAPVFVVADPSGDVRYLGGYSERKQGLVLRDLEILTALTGGQGVRELPLFGCAVSRALQRLFDPLRLKATLES
jgi:hypothetical protein